jgi:hypothetical protein
MVSKAGCGRGQGSAMNSLRSALTAVLTGPTYSQMQAKRDPEPRRCASDILTIELVQNIGQVKAESLAPGFTRIEPRIVSGLPVTRDLFRTQ